MSKRYSPVTTVVLISFLLLAGCVSTTAEDVVGNTSETLTTGFNHVGLTVSDLEASVEFITELLGWRKVGGYADYPSVFVTDGNMFVTLWQATDSEKAMAFNRKTNVGLHHLAISVASRDALDVLHQRFVDAGNVTIEFASEPNGGGPTIHMMIREPSGNRLEFAHNPPRKN